MELSEAKEILKKLIIDDKYMESKCVVEFKDYENSSIYEKRADATQLLLDYIESESIPKETIEKKIKELKSIGWQPGTRTVGKSVKYWKLVGAIDILQELLRK